MKLFFNIGHASHLNLGLRVGCKIHMKNVHCIRTSFLNNPEFNTKSFIACNNTTIEILEFSDEDNILSLSNYPERTKYFDSWIHVNQADIIVLEYLKNVFNFREIEYDNETLFEIVKLFGRQYYKPNAFTLLNHDRMCDIDSLNYQFPFLPSIQDLIDKISSEEWQNQKSDPHLLISNHKFDKIFGKGSFLIGMLTCDEYGNSFISNKDSKCALVFVDESVHIFTNFVYNLPYCIRDFVTCTESFTMFNSNQTYIKIYICLTRNSLIPLMPKPEIYQTHTSSMIKLMRLLMFRL